jgi:tetratricopeptide (TPR) repeat protein
MEENPESEKTANPALNEKLCINCQTNKFEPEYPTKLCYDCRNKFINFPIPKWILAFAAGIILVMVFGFIRMPKYFETAIHLSRAEKAMDEKKYFTAKKELLEVISFFPDNIEANGRLLITCSRTLEMDKVLYAFNKISDKNIEDKDLFAEIETVMREVETFFPRDSIMPKRIALLPDSAEALFNFYNTLEREHAQDLFIGTVSLADRLYEMKEYGKAEELSLKILQVSSSYYPALSLMSAIYRNNGKYEEGIKVCDQMLAMNAEDIGAISQKARIELKRKNDAKAAEYTQQAMAVDPENTSALEAKAMVEFFGNNKQESLKTLELIKRIEMKDGDHRISLRLGEIINGKEIYR